jgi:hypothetical protein
VSQNPLEIITEMLSHHDSEIRRLSNENVVAWAVMTAILHRVHNRTEVITILTELAKDCPGAIEERIMAMVSAVEAPNSQIDRAMQQIAARGTKGRNTENK